MYRHLSSKLRADLLEIFILIVLSWLIIYPFADMVSGISWPEFLKVISSRAVHKALMNSLKAGLAVTSISVPLALGLALSIQRTNIAGKGLLSELLLLPMLIPSLSVGTGLKVLFGANGVLKNLFGLSWTAYGFWGIVSATVIFSYPVAFIMLNDALKYEDALPYEAAEVLGIPKIRQVTAITLPYLKKPIISSVFAVFTLTVTDYGIPLMIGGRTTTLAMIMYQEVIGQMNFQRGAVLGIYLFVPALVTFVYNIWSGLQFRLSFISGQFTIRKNRLRDFMAYILCGSSLLCITVLLVTFTAYAFSVRYPRDMSFTIEHVRFMIKLNGLKYLANSLEISLFAGIFGTVIAFCTAYFTARVPSKISQVLHLISVSSLAIPGLVLGLAYVFAFRGTFIYGTIWILVLVNVIHFFSSPYLIIYNSLSKMNRDLESVGNTLGVPSYLIVRDVILPQMPVTLLEAFSYFFVNSMMTISAVSFLFSHNTKPLSLMIGQFEAQMNLECVGVVSLLIMAVNAAFKLLIYGLKKISDSKTGAINYNAGRKKL